MIARLVPAMSRWRTWAWIAGISIAAYLAYLLISGLLTQPAPELPNQNSMVMRGIISKGGHGNSNWDFVADSSEISPDGYSTTYHNVHKATYTRDGKMLYRLTAGTVTVDARNQNYAANSGVHVWSTAPTLPDDLVTDDAYWDQSSQTLTCPAATRFVYRGSIMHTTHMTVNMLTGASLLGDTTIDYFKPPPSPTPAVSAGPIPKR